MQLNIFSLSYVASWWYII